MVVLFKLYLDIQGNVPQSICYSCQVLGRKISITSSICLRVFVQTLRNSINHPDHWCTHQQKSTGTAHGRTTGLRELDEYANVLQRNCLKYSSKNNYKKFICKIMLLTLKCNILKFNLVLVSKFVIL